MTNAEMMTIEAEESAKQNKNTELKLELSDSALMIIGALKSNNAVDILQMLPKTDVNAILANRKAISSELHKLALEEVTANGEVLVAEAKIKMKVSMYTSFSK